MEQQKKKKEEGKVGIQYLRSNYDLINKLTAEEKPNEITNTTEAATR